MKNKIYWKEMIPMFIFSTIMFGVLFLTMWYSHSESVLKNMAHLASFGWVTTTIYILTIIKYKK